MYHSSAARMSACRGPRTASGCNTPTLRAFTIIEMLVTVLVLSVLMAVALPHYLAALADSQLKTCRANMQTIANAEVAYRVLSPGHTYTTDLTNLNGNLVRTPICPDGGDYSVAISDGTCTASNGTVVPAGGMVVKCSASGHGKFSPGFDAY